MYCIGCGLENIEGTANCIRCGQNLSSLRTDQYSPPAVDASRPFLWNPDVAALLSIPFSPIFGAVIHALNWRRLGFPRRATAAWLWAGLILLAFLGVGIYGEVARIGSSSLDGYFKLTQFSMLILWYFGTARAQGKFIVDQLHREYVRESWVNPLLAALVVLGACYGILGALA